ncbi:MAG: cadmium-translocating P-type ATPase [Candidatus Omnitrophica bacterium]|nr:cadmium-translocating P-type ATPase [Candidatus Omnitrophota bacterium]MDE2008854.1 cadmium-translocating P-type ATPase [Candidatus Omnitrophota bacterium]MDE2213583.1 cadmium-translocating P-type ATPase [Candidatus Omnitrophota bacterium]MDE2230516.1 cadmium-translocating P-type ATPase [Candidatus Omnitrophota bacterium]
MNIKAYFNKESAIAVFALVGIIAYLLLRFVFAWPQRISEPVLWAVLLFGGLPLVLDLLGNVFKGRLGSDLLAGISIITSLFLQEYLAGALVVLMLSGGGALEQFAVRRASSVLEALAKRMPNRAHRRGSGKIYDIDVQEIVVDDVCAIFPHEICPVDGIVLEGRSTMDESYLTGEPFLIPKTLGSAVISGAINGENILIVRATRRPLDSRYAKIMQVMNASQQFRPRLRRLADRLGAWYTPVSITIGLMAWVLSGNGHRFLAVMVVATPCPLLIAIPVAIIGAISLSAQRGIIIKDPAILESADECHIMILDKTGTLTYGRPQLANIHCLNGFQHKQILEYAATLERYSKHPLARAILEQAERKGLYIGEASQINEHPGEGLHGIVDQKEVFITGRKTWLKLHPADHSIMPELKSGLECVVVIGDRLGAVMQFHDKPRIEGRSFIEHLQPRHKFEEVMIVSGDHQEEVRYLADQMGIKNIYAEQSPEQKVEIVREYTKKGKSVYIGDGINDAPALLAATVGIAFGKNSDITAEAAGAVILENSLEKVDEFFHIARRMRAIALQSAVGGMLLSILGMFLAAWGFLVPVAGAIAQEIIDLMAVVNALRISFVGKKLSDF